MDRGPGPSALDLGCSCSSVWMEAQHPAPSPAARDLVNVSLPPRACPDHSSPTSGVDDLLHWLHTRPNHDDQVDELLHWRLTDPDMTIG
jgi:hypothetical protein